MNVLEQNLKMTEATIDILTDIGNHLCVLRTGVEAIGDEDQLAVLLKAQDGWAQLLAFFLTRRDMINIALAENEEIH